MHYSNGQPRSDTWELSQTGTTWTWTQVVTPGLPTNFYRFSSTLAFMAGDRQMVQFGGMRGSSTYYNDTSEYGAKVATFGVGCAGTNGVPALAAIDAPRLGQNWVLNVANLNPSINFAVIVLGLTQLPASTSAAARHDGMLGLRDARRAVDRARRCRRSTTWTWTAINGPIGAQFFCQALCLDPAANNLRVHDQQRPCRRPSVSERVLRALPRVYRPLPRNALMLGRMPSRSWMSVVTTLSSRGTQCRGPS
jgi:hypothetical protein